MANEFVAQLKPGEAVPINAGKPFGGIGSSSQPATNLGYGLGFSAGLNEPYPTWVPAAYWLVFVPAGTTISTGLTLDLLMVDDLLAPGAGLLATFDVTYQEVTSGTTIQNDAAFAGTADSGQVTMSSTSGHLTHLVITSVAAHVGGTLAIDTWLLVRVRRNPAASDTHLGRILLLSGSIRGT